MCKVTNNSLNFAKNLEFFNKQHITMGKFFKDFREFALKGNVVDMAVGVIIGGAFGKIVTSIVEDLIMPPIGYAIGGMKFDSLKIVLQQGVAEKLNKAGDVITPAVEEVAINYGNFIQITLNFFIIAMCVFLMIKLISKLSRKKVEEDAAAPAPEPSAEEKLLTEIRDLLKKD